MQIPLRRLCNVSEQIRKNVTLSQSGESSIEPSFLPQFWNCLINALFVALDQLSTECRETKTKEITLANHNGGSLPMTQSELEANTCSRRQARENACKQVTIGVSFTSDWLKKWHKIF